MIFNLQIPKNTRKVRLWHPPSP